MATGDKGFGELVRSGAAAAAGGREVLMEVEDVQGGGDEGGLKGTKGDKMPRFLSDYVAMSLREKWLKGTKGD